MPKITIPNRLVYCLVFLLAFGAPQCGGSQTNYLDKNMIVVNVKNACQQHRQLFAPSRMFFTQLRREAPNEEFRKADILLKTKGNYNQSVEIVSTGEGANKRVLSRNPDYSFALSGDSVHSTWILDELFIKGSGNLFDNLNLELHFLDGILYPTTYVNHIRIGDMLDSPAVVLTSEEIPAGDILLKMSIEDPSEKIGDFPINFFEVELFINPNSIGWLPYRYIHRERTPVGIHTRDVVFSNYKNENGVMVPQLLIATVQVDNGEPWKSDEHSFSWSFGNDLADREFTLSHYGFPEPDFGERHASPIRYALTVIGMLIVVYALWRLNRRRKGGIKNE